MNIKSVYTDKYIYIYKQRTNSNVGSNMRNNDLIVQSINEMRKLLINDIWRKLYGERFGVAKDKPVERISIIQILVAIDVLSNKNEVVEQFF